MENINPCCCCLLNSPHKSLKTPHIYFGTTEVFLDLLEECFQIQFTLDNEDGSGICEECEGRLRDASDFKRQVQRCQAKLQARRARRDTVVLVKDELPPETTEENETCDVSVSNEEPPASSEVPDDDATPEEGLISLSWRGAAGAVAQLAPPVPSPAEKQARPVASPAKKQARSEPAPAKTHARPVRAAAMKQSLTVPAPAKKQAQPLPAPAKKQARLVPAPAKNRARPVPAPARKQRSTTCSVRLERMRGGATPVGPEWADCPSIPSHMDEVNGKPQNLSANQQLYICDPCGRRFTRKLNLINHMRAHLITRAMYTPNLNEFMVIRPGKKPYGCKLCTMQFKIKYSLSRHTVVHTKLKSFSCEICNKDFKYKHDLTRHVKAHTGQKPYSCELCTKTFTQKTGLNQHMLIHTGQRPHLCPICYKTFRHKHVLNNHVRIHTGVKPYKCEICSKAFTERGQLRMHTRVHTGQRPYICEICDRRFAQKIHVAMHRARVHT